MARDGIFVSYRRSDSSASTNAVRQTLEREFGDAVFVDVTDIAPGTEFGERIDAALANTKVVIAVMGPDWLTVTNADGSRRLDDEDDWVRREVAASLAHDEVVVIPVRVDGAPQPYSSDLPEPLKGLSDRNTVILNHDTWDSDFERILDRIAELTGRARSADAPAAESPDGAGGNVNQTVEKGAAIAGDVSGTVTFDFSE